MKCDIMKPRHETYSYEVTQLIEKASTMKNRISALEKAKSCKDCGKKSCMKEGGCGGKMCKGVGDFKIPKEKITDVEPRFLGESGGQTRSAHFTTNGMGIDSEDAKPKRSKDGKKTDLQGLGRKMNPHEGSGADKENFMGGE